MIHWFNYYLLSNYYVPGVLPGGWGYTEGITQKPFMQAGSSYSSRMCKAEVSLKDRVAGAYRKPRREKWRLRQRRDTGQKTGSYGAPLACNSPSIHLPLRTHYQEQGQNWRSRKVFYNCTRGRQYTLGPRNSDCSERGSVRPQLVKRQSNRFTDGLDIGYDRKVGIKMRKRGFTDL